MNLTDNLMGEVWYWAAWVVWMPLFAFSLWRAPWGRLKDSELLNVWLGMVVLLTLVWSMRAGVKPGLALHLLGAMAFTLSFGPHLAFVGLSLVMAAVTLNGDAGPLAYAANALMLPGLSVLLSNLYFRVASAVLSKHFFVYIFVFGFLGAAVTILGVGFVATTVLALIGVYEWDYLIYEYFPYFLLLAFSEAWLSGMIMTIFVVYRPHWVVSFDDSSYLADK